MTESLTPLQVLRGGRYRLLSALRTGGSGVVWRGIDTRDAVVVALKAIPVSAGGAAAVEHEAEAVLRVHHAGAMRVHATFVEAGHGFIVMDLAACSLADIVEAHGPLPQPVALRIALTLCDVLTAAHKVGVVHRDVKPQNVLVMPDGKVRLADWGIARVLASGHARTRTGTILGTLAFMAPEQRRDPRDVCPATDVYALAATLAWMLTGAPPGELYVPEVAAALRHTLGEPIGGAILHAGQHSPGDRPATAEAFQSQLTECGARTAEDEDADAWLSQRSAGLGQPDERDLPESSSRSRSGSEDPRSSLPVPVLGPLRRSNAANAVLLLIAVLAATTAAGWLGWHRGDAAGRVAALHDPLSDLQRCPDAPSQWVERIERAPKETSGGDIVDVDGDGINDVLFANNYSESTSIWWGVRGAQPSEHIELSVGRHVEAPGVGDVDGDGLLDLIVPLFNDAAFTVVRGLGGRRFAEPTRIFEDPTPWNVEVFDINGDGNADLLFTPRPPHETFTRLSTPDKPQRFAIQRALLRAPEGTTAAHFVRGANGVALWIVQNKEVTRIPVNADGSAGTAEHYPQALPPVKVMRDSAHPTSVVVELDHGGEQAYVRVGPDQKEPCLLGRLPKVQDVYAFTDFDEDGFADMIKGSTCMYCDSNQIFARGVP